VPSVPVSMGETGLEVLLVVVFVLITLLLLVFEKREAVALGVSPVAPVTDLLILAHVSGTRPRLAVVNAGSPV